MPSSHLLTTAAGDRVRLHVAATGSVEWISDPINPSSPPVVAAPSGSDDRVYVGSADGWLYELALSTGAQLAKLPLWSPAEQEWVRGVAHADGVIYATAGNRLYAHLLGSGPQWKFDMEGLAWGQPVVADGVVYAGSWDGRLYAINANGTSAWISSDFDYFAAEPIVADGVVYADAWDTIVALNAQTGAVLWQANASNNANIVSPLAVGGGRIYAGTAWGGLICAFDAATGMELWNTSAGGHPTPPLYFNGRVFAATEHGGGNGYLRGYDAVDGHVIWQSQVPVGSSGDAVSRPMIDQGPVTDNVFVTSQDDHAYAFDANSGVLQWKQTIGGGWPVDPTWTDQATLFARRPFKDFVAVDPLSLVLRSDIYVKIKLPYPPPIEVAAARVRKAATGLTTREKRAALEQVQQLATVSRALMQAIETSPTRRAGQGALAGAGKVR